MPAQRPPLTRCGESFLKQALSAWRRQDGDLWVFAYASLIWRPEGKVQEVRPARVQGYHRALKMRSRVNRGSPETPGLVFALLPGGCCQGVAQRIARADAQTYLPQLWLREMPDPVYDPRGLTAHTPQGPVTALAFTLARHSPSHTGTLTDSQYRHIFAHARGRYGTTLDYARQTHLHLQHIGIHDHALGRLLSLAPNSEA
jgi:glutathione-specific gamma-glutamylcyclotransferase